MVDNVDLKAGLRQERATMLSQREKLQRELDEVFASVVDVATDDEHDPEGATLAYERARTQALLDQTDRHLDDIAAALARVDAGTYGTCIQCGQAIGVERLRALPAVPTCITCAAK